jgi:hypothetical protein
MSFRELFAQHVATGFARQLALADLIDERGWQLDLSQGMAAFGSDLRFPVQLLGTESHDDGTWLWAWANTGSNLPPQALQLVGWLRDYGQRNSIAELTDASFPLDRVDGHQLALVASGLTGRCYYRGPYDAGAVFFHLENVPAQVLAPVAPERALTVISQVLTAFPVDHRTFVLAFLQQQGWQVQATAEAITGRHAGGSDIRVDFDQLGRISNIGGQLRAG